jgi:hypothetical protein
VKSSVITSSPGTNSRFFAGSRTSARTTVSLCPVARSISSPLSASIRETAEPTVP